MGNYGEYEAMIKSIGRKKRLVIISAAVAALIVLIVGGSFMIELPGKAPIEYKGLHPALVVLLLLLIFLIEAYLYAVAIAPVAAALTVEGDPYKHMVLNQAIFKNRDHSTSNATDCFYLGDFESSINFAMSAVKKNKAKKREVLSGYENLARCAFFTGNGELLKNAQQSFFAILPSYQCGGKEKVALENIGKTINLMVAIHENDEKKMKDYHDIAQWSDAIVTIGFVSYLKGVAAFETDELGRAVYFFGMTEKAAEKTFLSKKASEYLQKFRIEKAEV